MSAISGTARATTCARRSSGSSVVASSSLARATMFASIRAARSPASAACVARSARAKRSRAFAAATAKKLPADHDDAPGRCAARRTGPRRPGPRAIGDARTASDRDARSSRGRRRPHGGEQRAEHEQRDQDGAGPDQHVDDREHDDERRPGCGGRGRVHAIRQIPHWSEMLVRGRAARRRSAPGHSGRGIRRRAPRRARARARARAPRRRS